MPGKALNLSYSEYCLLLTLLSCFLKTQKNPLFSRHPMPFCFPPIWVSWISKILGIGKRHYMSHITIRAEKKQVPEWKVTGEPLRMGRSRPDLSWQPAHWRPAPACHCVIHPQEHQAAAPRIKSLEVLWSECFLKIAVDWTHHGYPVPCI